MPDTLNDGADGSLARIAIVSTPRSGNTWLRGMLSRVFDLREIAIHTPEELDWDHAPARCVVQIHWHRTEPFEALLRRHGFRVVTLARHPLDVFLSTLNYTHYVHRRDECGQGPSCVACSITEAKPRDPAFLDYCRDWPGRRTLSFSLDWWSAPGVHRARYEDLVNRPSEALGDLVAALGLDVRRPIDEAVADYDMERLRTLREASHYHYWQGRPGLWRAMLPAAEAHQIAAAHPEVFATLGYRCDPDESLTDFQADLNWFQVQHAAMRKHLRDERAKHEATRRDLAEAHARLASIGHVSAETDGQQTTRPAVARSGIEPDRTWRVHPSISTLFRRIARRPTPINGPEHAAR